MQTSASGIVPPGSAKNTYGTGCFLLMNTGTEPIASANNLLTTIGWGVAGEVTYCLEGSDFTAGAVVQWLRDGLGVISYWQDIADVSGNWALDREFSANIPAQQR